MVNFKNLRQMIAVKGNGNIVTREIPVSSFIRLHLGVHGSVELIQSSEEKVVIEADENLIDYFEAVNSGRTLYVSSEAKWWIPSFTKGLVKVYFRQLDKIRNCCHGHVYSSTPIQLTTPLEVKIQSHGDTDLELDVPALNLIMQCHGDVTLKGKCGQFEIKDQAHGNLKCRELKAQSVNINNMSHGDIDLFADESISIKHMGHGHIHYYGKGILKDIRQYGNGEIKHMDV
jgi:hypothetical protein